MKFLRFVDMAQNEIRNPAFHLLASAPSSPIEGQFYYDTTLHQFGYRTASAWVYPTAGGGITNAYTTMTDGTTPASASGTDTFKFRTGNTAISIATGNNDATHGDNLLITFNVGNVDHNSLANLTTGDPHTQYTLASGTRAFSGNQSMGGFLLTNVGSPSASTDAATKGYVDTKVQGLDAKASAAVMSTANLSTSGTPVIDGYQTVAGDRVLLTGQGTASQNGLWVVAAGAWTRPTDFAAGASVNPDVYVFVNRGTVNADTGWVLTNDTAITVDTTAQTWVQFSSAGQITAANMGTLGQGPFKQKSGTQLQFYNYNAGSTRLTIAAPDGNNNIAIDVAEANLNLANIGGTLPVNHGGTNATAAGVTAAHNIGAVAKAAGNIGNGSLTSIDFVHNLGTLDVTVQVYDNASPANAVWTDFQLKDTNTITLIFTTAPATNAYRVVVTG